MSLFPAYAPSGTSNGATPSADNITAPPEIELDEWPLYMDQDPTKEIDDVCSPDAAEEATLLESSPETSSSENEKTSRKRKAEIDDEVSEKKKKKRKHKKKKNKYKSNDIMKVNDADNFYVDKKPDPGNVLVSTLYYPARPEYHQAKLGICITMIDRKKSKKRWKRYYEVDVRFYNEKNYHTGQTVEKDGNMGDFENIGDSKNRWDDSRTEKELTEKTASFNKYLAKNPHNVEKWLEFVNFQENRYLFDTLNYRAASESSARDVCRQKQLAILEKALFLNPGCTEIFTAKLKLDRIMKPSPEYLTVLKDLIATETDPIHLTRLWCTLAEGVFGSAALCSSVSVKESYAAAVTALRRDQRAYVEIFYRYGLFLRHSGLLEQLFLLMDLVTAMNFTKPTDAFKCDSQEKIAERERILADEETKLTTSGLPLSVVWTRVESARSAAHWRTEPGTAQCVDPQRCPDASDVADLIAPVTKPAQLFILLVHVLRLCRVPLLPPDHCTGALLRALHPAAGAPEWDADSAEELLPLICEFRQADYRNIVARHAALPNYFQHAAYLTFIEELFASCLEWTTGDERLALLLWWIRFQAAVLSLNSENRTEAVRVRKSLQKTLKRYASSPLAFACFSSVERAACGDERATHVAVAALRAADREPRATRLAIARCICSVSGSESVGSWALVCAALGRSLPLDLSAPPSQQLLQEAYLECVNRSDQLWRQAKDDMQDVDAAECLLPSDDTEWWLCRYDLRARMYPAADDSADVEAMFAEAKTQRSLRMHEAASVGLASHAGKCRGRVALTLLQKHPENVRLAAVGGARPAMPTLPPPPPPSTVGALAAVLPLLVECEETKSRTPFVGSERRALAALRNLTAQGAAGARSPLLWRLRLDAEARFDGGNAKTALYLALDACPAAKDLYVEGVRAAPSEFSELTDLLLEKQLRLHTLPEEITPL